MFELGMELLPFGHLPLETGLEEVSKLGYKGVNLWSAMPPLADPINPGDAIDEIKALLKKYDLKATGLSMYCWPQEEMLKRIDFASELGIDTVIFHCHIEYKELRDTFIPPLLKRAEEKGIKVALENHVKMGAKVTDLMKQAAHTLDEIKIMIKEIDHPNFGICVAPPHLWATNQSITDTIEFLIERNKLFFYYVWDINSKYKDIVEGWNFWECPGPTQTPKPDGAINHFSLLKLLKTLGYGGVVSVKSHGFVGWKAEDVAKEMRKATDYVRDCILNL